jgi:hypothetical protein
MRTLAIWGNLIPDGIIPVPLSLPNPTCHVLCDVTEKGKDLVLQVLCLPDVPLDPARTKGHHGVIGSLHLPKDLRPLLSVHALFAQGCTEAYCLGDGTVVGVEPKDTAGQVEAFRNWHWPSLTRRFQKAKGLVVEVPLRDPKPAA